MSEDDDGRALKALADAGAPVSGRSFRYAVLDGLDFTGAALAGLDIVNASVRGACFTGADLTGLSQSDIEDDLTMRDGRGARFDRACLRDARIGGISLEGVDFRGADCTGASFIIAGLRGADFRGADLSGAVFEADLRGADLRGACLEGVTLRWCDLSGARIDAIPPSAQVEDCLLGASGLRLLYAAGVRRVEDWGRLGDVLHRYDGVPRSLYGFGDPWDDDGLLKDTIDLSGAAMPGLDFGDVCWRAPCFGGADLQGARFGPDSRLPGADFRGADLRGATLRHVELVGADFTGARLDGADLAGALLDGARGLTAAGSGGGTS